MSANNVAIDIPPAFYARVDRKSTRLNSSHANISYAVFCLKKKKKQHHFHHAPTTGLAFIMLEQRRHPDSWVRILPRTPARGAWSRNGSYVRSPMCMSRRVR